MNSLPDQRIHVWPKHAAIKRNSANRETLSVDFCEKELQLTSASQTMALLIVLTLFIVQANAEKRLLLNDPDVILSQLHALERKMEDKYTDLSVKYNALLAQTNEIHAKNTHTIE